MFQDPIIPCTPARGVCSHSGDAEGSGTRNPRPLRVTRVEHRPLAEAELRARLARAFDLLGLRSDVLQTLPDRAQTLICEKGRDQKVEPLTPES
jgi:hypothetical protein